MRILQVINSLDPTEGGPAEQTRQIGIALSRMGHHVEILTSDDPNCPWLEGVGLTVHAIRSLFPKIYGFSSELVPWLKAHAQEFDAVIVRGIWCYCSLAVWLALRHKSAPYFVYPHGMLDPWFKIAYPFKHIKKRIYWSLAEYRVLRDAKGVLFTCEEEKLLARKSFSLYGCNEIVVKYGTASCAKESSDIKNLFLSSFPQLKGKRIFLFLGRIHPKKGCDLLIRAFARIASRDDALQLVIAGPDQIRWQRWLRRMSEGLGVGDRITWPGVLAGDLKVSAYESAEIFILPSHQENFGISVAEALSHGVPVLISDKVNIWREIMAGSAGLVGTDSLEGVAGLLNRWLGMDRTGRESMRGKARECFLNNFEITAAANSLIEVLNKGR